jgi:magnesium chelatase family protein
MRLLGIDAIPIEVEVDISSGLAYFANVGLRTVLVRREQGPGKGGTPEHRYPFPMERITVNLAPANLKKEARVLIFPLLSASSPPWTGEFEKVESMIMTGELALDGRLSRSGLSFQCCQARDSGYEESCVPAENARGGLVIESVRVRPVGHLSEIVSI